MDDWRTSGWTREKRNPLFFTNTRRRLVAQGLGSLAPRVYANEGLVRLDASLIVGVELLSSTIRKIRVGTGAQE